MNDDRALALLALIGAEAGISTARAAKRLGLAQSELARLLAALGGDASCDGLDLVVAHDDGGRTTLRLTERGRALLAAR